MMSDITQPCQFWLGPTEEFLRIIKKRLIEQKYDGSELEIGFRTLRPTGNVSRITSLNDSKNYFYVKLLSFQEVLFWLFYYEIIKQTKPNHGFGSPRYVEQNEFKDSFAIFPDYGRTLFKYIKSLKKQQSAMTLRDISLWVKPFLMILKNLHILGWIHCDIKPQNILVLNSQIKLIDFGLSHRIDELISYHGSGNPEYPYVAPELFEEKKCQASPKLDVYSFGMTLLSLYYYIYLKTKRRSYTRTELNEFLKLEIKPRHHKFFLIIDKMIQKNPAERCSMEEIQKYFY